MSQAEDLRWMAAALALADRGAGQTWPNPSVACLIVRDGRLLARARTGRGGRPHAEPQALALCDARGATVYVTLEPCAHQGQTPPCAEALIRAGVARVVIAAQDPDPRVDGGGIARLRAAGISVDTGLMTPEARRQNAGFFSRIERARPLLTLKLATTLDGRIATASGESQWITGPQARRHVHSQRARHDAVMVGAGTLRADDAQLSVRGLGVTHQPVRILVSGGLDLPADGAIWQVPAPLWICHGLSAPAAAAARLSAKGARLIPCASDGAHVNMADALHRLGQAGLTQIYCEGGGALAASLLRAGLVDRLHLYTAGKIIGAEGRPSLGALGLDRMEEAPKFTLTEARTIGADLFQAWDISG